MSYELMFEMMTELADEGIECCMRTWPKSRGRRVLVDDKVYHELYSEEWEGQTVFAAAISEGAEYSFGRTALEAWQKACDAWDKRKAQ